MPSDQGVETFQAGTVPAVLAPSELRKIEEGAVGPSSSTERLFYVCPKAVKALEISVEHTWQPSNYSPVEMLGGR